MFECVCEYESVCFLFKPKRWIDFGEMWHEAS